MFAMALGGGKFIKRHPKVGARPGTLVIDENSPPPRIRVIQYAAAGVDERELAGPEMLDELSRENRVTWIDIQGFGDEKTIRAIGKRFELHPLAMEDVVNIPQRPKTEMYEHQVLIVSRMVSGGSQGEIAIEQVTIVLGPDYVLTFQERYGDILDPVRERIRRGKGPIRRNQADFLAYAILDTLVDGFYPVLEELGEYLEKLENLVLDHPTPKVLRRLNRTKNTLVNLRRAIWPQREAVNSMMRDDSPLIGDNVRLHLRDTYDHCVQTAEVAEMYREMVTGLMNTYLSAIANRTNDIMKALTIMASIFIPLTFMAGVYGMNFEYMPELRVRWAYPAVWTTMLVVVAAMLLYFRRKGWIGAPKIKD